MEDKIQTLTKYRFEKASEDLKASQINIKNNLIKASINRSYYAIFHAIRAVNAIDEFDSKKHSGVIAHFNQFYIHTGKFEKEIYSIIISAYKIREKSDYDDFYIASNEEAEEQLKNAEVFLEKVEKFLNSNFGID